MLAALLFLVGAIPAKASLRPCTVQVDLKVVRLPDGPVADMTKSLDPIAGAIVEVAELGRKGRSDKGGQASFTLPAGPKCLPAVFTFVVSTAGSPYKSVVRRIFHTPSGGLLLFHRPDQDLYIDESFKRPRQGACDRGSPG